jgi:hypothetical protein
MAQIAAAADLPQGQIIDSVSCAADSSQSYALYLPSNYTQQRKWPVILAFDPAARGRTPVERYQAAAEQYGYIIAGSRNSRNGSWEVSLGAARAMLADVLTRFAIDEKRIYTAGMSGGSRVALSVALGSKDIAGVFASSAGWPDNKPRKTVPFPIFETAGSEDFNYREMRGLDRDLTSPHHLMVFLGGHTWLPADVAMDAVEWMEVEAMRSGRRAKDPELLARLFGKRTAAAEKMNGRDQYLALLAIASDFEGLEEVAPYAARASALGRERSVRDALKKDREEETREDREMTEMLTLESRLASQDQRMFALNELKDRWKKLAAAGSAASDTSERRVARRIMGGLALGASERTTDAEYRAMIDKYRPARGR